MLGYTLPELRGQSAHSKFHHTRPSGTGYPADECPTHTSMSEGATHRVTDEVFRRKDGTQIAVDYTTAPVREREGSPASSRSSTTSPTAPDEKAVAPPGRPRQPHRSLQTSPLRRGGSEQLAYSQRYGRAGVLLLMDLDSFKFVNDSYGIRSVTSCSARSPQPSPLRCVRPTSSPGSAGTSSRFCCARQASRRVRRSPWPDRRDPRRRRATIGASAGVAPFGGDVERTPDELLIAADVALYECKEAAVGRRSSSPAITARP